MSVDHFFTKAAMGDIKETKITAINIFKQNLIIGDSSGNVSSYEMTSKNKITLVQSEFLQKSKVEQIVTLPNQSVSFVLCQGEISVLLIPSLAKKNTLKIKEPIEKIFYNKEDKDCENVILCITKKKKVKTFDFDPKTYNLAEQPRSKDIYVEDIPNCGVWADNSLVYSYGNKTVSWMDLATGKQNPVDFEGAVQLMNLGGKIGLTSKEMVLFMKDAKAFSFNPILHTAKDFIWFVEYKNYLIGLYKNNIEVLRKGEQEYKPVESIELNSNDGQGKFIIASKTKVVIVTETGQGLSSCNIIDLKERPIEQQIEVLINKLEFDSALEKLIENIPEDDDTKIEKVESFFLDCAYACVEKKSFDLALKYISLTNFNPFEFIYMFYDSLSVNIIHNDKKKTIVDNRLTNQLLKIDSSEDESKKVYSFLVNILLGKRDYILSHFKFPEEKSKNIVFLSSKLAKINLSNSTTEVSVQKTLDAINLTLIKSMIKLKKTPKEIESVLDNKSIKFEIFDEFIDDLFFTDEKIKELNETRFTLAYIKEKKGDYETALAEWEKFGTKKDDPNDKLGLFTFEARDRTKKIFYKFKDTKGTDRIRKENLFRKHIKWLLRKYPNEAFEVAIKTELVGIKVFMDEIIPDVEKESQESKIESGKLKELFLEYCNQNQQTENYQTQLLELYAEKMFSYVKKDEPKLNLNLEGDLKKYYDSFMKIIKDPQSCYNKKTILDYIEKSWLRDATLYLYSQLKEHDKALTELFNNAKLSNSFKDIEDYCTANLKAKPDIFQNFYKLLSDIVKNDCQGQIDKNLAEIEQIDRDLITKQQEHITEGEKKEANETKEKLKEEIQRMEELKKPYEKEMLKILKDYGTIDNLDPLFALNYADDHWNICDNNEFYNYLQNVVREYTIEGNKYKIGKNLSEMGLIYKEKEAIDFKNKCVTIDSEKTCDLCKKKIGNTIFVVYPNLRVYHVKCSGNPNIDPMTGVDFSKKKFV